MAMGPVSWQLHITELSSFWTVVQPSEIHSVQCTHTHTHTHTHQCTKASLELWSTCSLTTGCDVPNCTLKHWTLFRELLMICTRDMKKWKVHVQNAPWCPRMSPPPGSHGHLPLLWPQQWGWSLALCNLLREMYWDSLRERDCCYCTLWPEQRRKWASSDIHI